MSPALACQVNEWQATWIYRPCARGPVHIDCWGVVLLVSDYLGAPCPPDPMMSAASFRDIEAIFSEHMLADDWKDCEPSNGAVAFFGQKGSASHAGICIGDGVLDISRRHGVRFRKFDDVTLPDKMEYARWVG